MNTDFALEQFLNREKSLSHLAMEKEYAFYRAVAEGDEEGVSRHFMPLTSEGLGKLSDNTVRNMKYHLIITIALLTRFCIESGLPAEDAYSLSDIYIRRVDVYTMEEQVSSLHREIVNEYTRRMQNLKRKSPFSMHVTLAVEYIDTHLHSKISLAMMAESLGIGKTYLCDIFRKETGFTVGEYINRSRIRAAENMLKYSEYSGAEIGNFLGFSGHSHFISAFRKETGMTPGEYRAKNFRKEFINRDDV